MQLLDSVFVLVIIMFSAIVHEVAHGVAAERLGDPTARRLGRITLNPLVHLDLFGSVMLPLILILSGSPILLGWAKPVPYNPFNLVRAPRFGEAIVAFAGPLSNLVLALLGGLLIRADIFSPDTQVIILTIVTVNTMLALFNLLPVPPLDGSKILAALLPGSLGRSYERFRMQLENNPFLGMGAVLLVVLLLGGAFGSLVYMVARAIAGI